MAVHVVVRSQEAMAAAYTEYWNNSFSSYSQVPIKVSRHQIWQAFVGVDENRRVPGLVEGADLTNPGLPDQPHAQSSFNDDMDIDDGIVMGPTVCKYTS